MKTLIRSSVQQLLCTIAIAALLGCGTTRPTQSPELTFPRAEKQTVVDAYFGTEVADSYRWLEDTNSQGTKRWMKDAGAHAEATLGRIPGREALRARIAELESGATAQIGRVLRLADDLYVYERRAAADDQFAIVMRRGVAGEDRMLVDPKLLSRAQGGAPVAVNFFSASPMDAPWPMV